MTAQPLAAPISPAEFLSAAPTSSPSGSSAWAARYAVEMKRILHEAAARAPRTLQTHLGPSELGVECDRQVAGKLAALPATNHVVDPWPSMRGTALHAYAADAFTGDNDRSGRLRWLAEQRVVPTEEHPGTADLYDADEQAVVDHKFLSASSMAKARSGLVHGAPLAQLRPRKYVVQLLLYGLGYLRLGLPVRRVVLAAYPATAGSLDGLYVWDYDIVEHDVEVWELISQVLDVELPRRKQLGAMILAGLPLTEVPATPDSDECYFCPFYRPQSGHDGGPGCPGTVAP